LTFHISRGVEALINPTVLCGAEAWSGLDTIQGCGVDEGLTPPPPGSYVNLKETPLLRG